MSSHPSWFLRFQKLPLVLLASLLVAGMIIGLRNWGVFEQVELGTYDRLIAKRSTSTGDERILLVAIDDETLRKLNSDKVSDQALTQVLKNLEKYQPRVIGVDVLRDVPVGEGREELINYLNNLYDPLPGKLKPIILTCKLPSADGYTGIEPPPVLDLDTAVGFANLEPDKDQVVRRVQISSVPAPNAPLSDIIPESSDSNCLGPFSLGFLVALKYLDTENIRQELTEDEFFQLKDVVFKPLSATAGGYHNLDPSVYQILIDYQLKNKVEQVSFFEVLDGNIQARQVRNKVVLIGYTTLDGDVHLTPYDTVAGVFIQAQIVNQILSNVLDNRPVIWYLSDPAEWVWITTWGLVGGIIAWKCRPLWLVLVGQGLSLIILGGITLVMFAQGGWIPLIPPLLTLVLAAVTGRIITQTQLQVEPQSLPQTEYIPPLPFRTEEGESAETIMEPAHTPDNHKKAGSSGLSQHRQPFIRSSPFDRYIGKRLGEAERYLIDKHIGGGGMGQVYLASDTKLRNKKVAIKVMTKVKSISEADNDNLLHRFDREVGCMAAFTGMNIVKINDFGLTAADSVFEGAPFYVMEYLEGVTLTKRLREVGRLPLDRAIPIIRQICAGLKEAHDLNIVHRDLKPDNIYLIPHPTFGEIVKILDFGIAKIVIDEQDGQQKGPTLTQASSFIGTYRYASPEQCLGESTIDNRTDIYSLGVLIYEMLSATNPYNIQAEQDNTLGMWISSHISRQPRPLNSQPGCETMPTQINDLVMKCLQKNPDDRFANIDELEADLKAAIAQIFRNPG